MTGTPTATADAVLDAAEHMAQSVGYNGLSFRDLAAAVGIKSASVHYHFPTKAILGAAIARRYTDRLIDHLEAIDALGGGPENTLAAYVAVFRTTLEQDGRMCLCGMLGAETDSIPQEVRAEVRRFVTLNVQWITAVLGPPPGPSSQARGVHGHATAIFAALEGATLIARSTGDIAIFDTITAQLHRVGLIPAKPDA